MCLLLIQLYHQLRYLSKMSAVKEAAAGDSSLAQQCLAFCQTLANQGRTFSLTVGSSFIFYMESNGLAIPAQVVKKKPSPSTLQRNAKRRQLFLKRKLESSLEKKAPRKYRPFAVAPSQLSSAIQVEGKPFHCDMCTASFVSRHGLKYHTESTHRVASTQSSMSTSIPHRSPALILNTAPNIFPCDLCTSSFSYETALKIHMEYCHKPGKVSHNSGMVFQHLIPDNWG